MRIKKLSKLGKNRFKPRKTPLRLTKSYKGLHSERRPCLWCQGEYKGHSTYSNHLRQGKCMGLNRAKITRKQFKIVHAYYKDPINEPFPKKEIILENAKMRLSVAESDEDESEDMNIEIANAEAENQISSMVSEDSPEEVEEEAKIEIKSKVEVENEIKGVVDTRLLEELKEVNAQIEERKKELRELSEKKKKLENDIEVQKSKLTWASFRSINTREESEEFINL